MLRLTNTSKFKKDYARESKVSENRDLDQILNYVTYLLITEKVLPKRYKLHRLRGQYSGYLECHLKPNLLLIYKIVGNEIVLTRLGSHSEVFR
mgnify:CR=1 FL=1